MALSPALRKRVLDHITPTPKELAQEQAFAAQFADQLQSLKGPHVDVVLAGSLSRNTHLAGDRDMDFFVRYSTEMDRETFEKEGLALAKKSFGKNPYQVAYSEHPYVKGVINGFEVEVVPCYAIDSVEQKQSSVDRTVLHTQYLQRKLLPAHLPEIRLLKKWLKGIGCYGADLHAHAVPGIVAEILVVQFGTFEQVLEELSRMKLHHVIDLEQHFDVDKAQQKFDPAPLIVIDPIDPNRNVAAALSLEVMAKIITASHRFLQKPSLNYFFPPQEKPLTGKQLAALAEKEGLIVAVLPYPKGALSDEVWGQIHRFDRKMVSILQEKSFIVERHDAWTDETKHLLFVWELQDAVLGKAQRRVGPPIWHTKHVQQFLNTHKKVVTGPRIENDRVVVETMREVVDAVSYLQQELPIIGKKETTHLKTALSKKPLILQGKKLVSFYQQNKNIQTYLTHYAKGKDAFFEW